MYSTTCKQHLTTDSTGYFSILAPLQWGFTTAVQYVPMLVGDQTTGTAIDQDKLNIIVLLLVAEEFGYYGNMM